MPSYHNPDDRLIVVDEETAFIIKQALSQLRVLDAVRQRQIQDELNRRAINLVCQELIDCGVTNEVYCTNIQDPLHYKVIVLQDDKCVVHDINGMSWLLIGI